ncbi:hypothetical protein ACH5RR_027994 [Cinchona calisaya]|uniref:BHLH domain-containing protein n=1 Tax=Cinchona calisaya TaxID=153742 RepID=A0ABD2YSS8_9GENT
MADEFQLGSGGNWWDSSSSSSSRNRFDNTGSSAPVASSSLNNSFGWPTEIVAASRSCMDSSGSAGSSMIFSADNSQLKLQPHESSSSTGAAGLLQDPNLQMMGLGLSSQSMDWNQALFRGEKAESSFRSMLQEEASTNFHQESSGVTSSQEQWSRQQKLYGGSPEDSTASYGVQGLLITHDNQPQQQSSLSMNYQYPSSSYGGMSITNDHHQLMPTNSWSKFPQFLRTSSPPTQPPPPPPPPHGQLHFSNNTPFWNASSTTTTNEVSNLFHSLQPQLPILIPNFEEKPKNTSEIRDLSVAKKSNSEPSNKRPRNDQTPAPLPPFKVRKEKMGDRITALQQLVSPFGKTDTASVLSEAIEYIKFLHEQVNALSTPYMKNGAPIQQQQNLDRSKDPEGPKQDLRSRGLCLVPVSSTFPVTNETMVEFWTPTFGGTFR